MKPSRFKPTEKELGQLMRIYKPTNELRMGRNGVVVVKRAK